MTMHSPHPDTHAHGLQDDCPRCAEHAEHPVQSLDQGNLSRIMAIACDRGQSGAATYLDQVAAARVLTDLEHAGHLARTSPELFFGFLERYGIFAVDGAA